MKKSLKLLTVALAALCLVSCGKSFQDIKVTSCELVSLSPRGLSSLDATISLEVDNPTVQVTLTGMYAVAKMDGVPCLHFTADDLTLSPRSKEIYTIEVHGNIDDGFNPFQLLVLLQNRDMDLVTIDVKFRGTLKSGLGKDFEYKDIPLKDLLDKI